MIAAAIWAKNPEYVASCSDWLPNLQKAITLLTWTLRHKSISVKFSQSCFFRNICRMTQIQKQHGHPSPYVDPKGPPSGLSKDLRAGFADLCGRGQLRNLFNKILLSQIPLNRISWISSIIMHYPVISGWINLLEVYHFMISVPFSLRKQIKLSAGQSLTKYSIYNAAHILGKIFWGRSLLHSICFGLEAKNDNLSTVNPKGTNPRKTARRKQLELTECWVQKQNDSNKTLTARLDLRMKGILTIWYRLIHIHLFLFVKFLQKPVDLPIWPICLGPRTLCKTTFSSKVASLRSRCSMVPNVITVITIKNKKKTHWELFWQLRNNFKLHVMT